MVINKDDDVVDKDDDQRKRLASTKNNNLPDVVDLPGVSSIESLSKK